MSSIKKIIDQPVPMTTKYEQNAARELSTYRECARHIGDDFRACALKLNGPVLPAIAVLLGREAVPTISFAPCCARDEIGFGSNVELLATAPGGIELEGALNPSTGE